MMKGCVGLFLLLSCGMFHLGSGLKCYNCLFSNCDQIQQCNTEDSCLSLKVGDLEVRRCMKYSDCDFQKLAVQFPQYSNFKFSCCQGDLCNSGNVVRATTPMMVLLVSLLSVFWCWI